MRRDDLRPAERWIWDAAYAEGFRAGNKFGYEIGKGDAEVRERTRHGYPKVSRPDAEAERLRGALLDDPLDIDPYSP